MVMINPPWDWLLPLDQQPGKTMHSAWWSVAGLENYRPFYTDDASLQRYIDSMLRCKLNLSALVQRPEYDPRLWHLRPESAYRIVLAQGIVLAGGRSLLFQKRFCSLLEEWFSSHEIALLAAMIPAAQTLTIVPEEDVVNTAVNIGIKCLNTLFVDHPVWQRLRLLWPPELGTLDITEFSRSSNVFSRLVRVL